MSDQCTCLISDIKSIDGFGCKKEGQMKKVFGRIMVQAGVAVMAFGILGAPAFAYKDGDNTYEWRYSDGNAYWYENGVKQGVYNSPGNVFYDGIERGREIYDRKSDGWYWLDAVYEGAKAMDKEVFMPYIYQGEDGWSEEEKRMNADSSDAGLGDYVLSCMNNKTGKWVRYDSEGKMFKGWLTIEGSLAELYPEQAGNTYYYDHRTGLMAKGTLTIDGKEYKFDEVTGALLDEDPMLEYREEVLKLVNEERKKNNLSPYKLNTTLCRRADIRAAELVENFSHQRPDGTDCFTVIDDILYWYAGENIAAGYSTPEAVVGGWMGSPGHRANILSSEYTEIGIGVVYDNTGKYRWYWVQLFIG